MLFHSSKGLYFLTNRELETLLKILQATQALRFQITDTDKCLSLLKYIKCEFDNKVYNLSN